MIDLVDNIGVLIDESVEIPDIDKEDEFIIQIHDPILNEGLDYQLKGAGIILEGTTKSSTNAASKERNARNEADTDTKGNVAKRDEDDSKEGKWMSDVEQQVGGKLTSDHIKQTGSWNKGNDKPSSDGALDADAPEDNWASPAVLTSQAKTQMAKRERQVAQDKADADASGPNGDGTGEGSRKYTPNEPNPDHVTDSPGFLAAIGAAVKENPLVALGGAVIAAAGGYLIYRYMNSIYRLNKATNYYSKLASSTSDPAKKAKYQQKASTYANRLESAKAKARENKKDFIGKTKEMQVRYSEMKKSGGDAKELAKMEKKLTARNKVLSKIGAI